MLLLSFFISSIRSLVEITSISIGFFGLIVAMHSLESTTAQLKDIQTDYWNVRGLDQDKQRNYHNALQAFDRAIRIDPQSIKCRINKAIHYVKTARNIAMNYPLLKQLEL